MFSEERARKKFLEFINKNQAKVPPYEITSINISSKKDYWIIGANVIDPYPKDGGVYGYLLDNSSGEIIVCGYEGPEAYIEDKYDLENASGKHYIISPCLDNSRKNILTVKNIFNITYSQAIYLVRENHHWYLGKRRYLNQVINLLNDFDIQLSIILCDEHKAIVHVNQYYWWKHEPIDFLARQI